MSYLENFHYSLTGNENSPKKLVFLHGVMGFGANWRRIAKHFEGEYHVLCYDQRGHGRSFHPSSGYSPEDYADDLVKILKELAWEKIYLVGHSMGGRVAYNFASRFPEVVTQLVIEDMGASKNTSEKVFNIDLLDSVPTPFENKRLAKEWFERDFLEIYKNLPHRVGLSQFMYANITEDESKRGVWRFYEPGIRQSILQVRASDRWNEVENLKMPTLVVRGANSKDLTQAELDKMVEVNANIKGAAIPGAGHWVHSDQPELFIQELEKFFR